MRTIEKYLIALYFFISPAEIALHLLVTSSTKYVGLAILIIETCILLTKGRKAEIGFSASTISIILWCVYCVLSLAWVSLNEYTYEYLSTYLLMSALLIVTTFELWDSGTVKLYLYTYLFGSLLMAIISILFAGGKYLDRDTIVILGRECDPNQVAANIIPGIVIFLDVALKKHKSILINICCYVGTAVCVYSVFNTGSRGGFVALLFGIIAVIIIGKVNRVISVKQIIIAVIIGIAVYSYFFLQQDWRVLDFGSYTGTYANGSGRTVIWKALLKSFDVNWIWGHGVGSSISYFKNEFGKAVAVHNTFLLVLYEVGVLGFSIFAFSFVNMAYYHRKNGALFSIIIGSMISSIFLDALNQRYLWNSLMICILQYNANSNSQSLKASNRSECRYFK